jgi:hypothetical protein
MPEYVGKVTKKPFGKGSKSESGGIFLDTEEGQYVLRREGGNPFHDTELQKLVGKTIRCTGLARDYVLRISAWTELA